MRRRDPEIGGHGSSPGRSRVIASIQALPSLSSRPDVPSNAPKNAHRLCGADVEGSGDDVAAKGFGFGKGVGAAPVVIDEPGEGGALAVIEIEIGLV